MQNSSRNVRRMCVMSMLCAVSFMAVAIIRIPVIDFLKYEPKDVILTIGGFLFGPLAGGIMATVVALIEMVTVSNTGLIGCVMNILSSCLFVCTAATIYQHRKTLSGAIFGLICGSFATTAAMILWNFLITPLYMGIPREAVIAMLPTVFLPFNLLKTALNSTLSMLLYKPAVHALRSAHLLPPAQNTTHQKHYATWVIALFILLTLIGILLAWKGII